MKTHAHTLARALGLLVATHATLPAQTTLYWGAGSTDNPATSVDTSSQAVNPGTWNDALLNWNTSASATTDWQAWVDGSIAVIKSNKTDNSNTAIDLAADIAVGGISIQFDSGINTGNSPVRTSFGGGNWTTVSSVSGTSSAQTYTINGTGGAKVITLNNGAILSSNNFSAPLIFGSDAILAGTDGLNILGRVQVSSVSTVSGKATLAGIFTKSASNGGNADYTGLFQINAGGSLANISTFDIGRMGTFTVTKNTADNPLADNATVILRNAAFDLNASSNNVAVSETIGGLVLEGSGRLDTVTASSPNANGYLTLNLADGIDRGANGKGILYAYSGSNTNRGGLGVDSQNGLVITGHGLAANQNVITWGVVQGLYKDVNGVIGGNLGSTRFMATDASGNLVAAASTAASANLSAWASAGYTSSSNLHLELANNSNDNANIFSSALTGDVTLGTLAIGKTGSTSSIGTLDLGGYTLKANAIAAASNASMNIILGSTDANRGTLTTATAGQDLVLIHEQAGYANNNNFTINSVVTDNSVPTNLVLGGATGRFILNTANTHTGKTYVNSWMVELGANGRLLTTSELNISSGSTFTATSNAAQNKWGSASIAQTLSGGGLYIANAQTVEIGADGVVEPGSFGAGETLSFAFTTGKLNFLSGSTVALTLGSKSDSISFASTGDWLSGTFKLDLTSGAGFESGVAYTVFRNVTTTGFTPGSVWLDGTQLVSGDDYTWAFADNAYSITLVGGLIPEPSTAALLAGLASLGLIALRRRR